MSFLQVVYSTEESLHCASYLYIDGLGVCGLYQTWYLQQNVVPVVQKLIWQLKQTTL